MLVRPGTDGDGDLDVLIVLTGEPTDVDDLRPTLQALHGMSRRTTIVTCVPYESCANPIDAPLGAAIDRLTSAAARLQPASPRLIVLPGHPKTAPTRFADTQRIGLTLYAGPHRHV
jgi:hypothetical protein